jgi:uncharacterized protein (TIGR02271 family)
MNAASTTTVVGVFDDRDKAKLAVRELKNAGFSSDEIGLASPGQEALETETDADDAATGAGTGALTGAAAGAGVGALWGLGILAGVLPAIGPAIAGGTLAVLLSSAAAGAAAAGLAGALIGMGLSTEEAEYYESEVKAGRTLVSVRAGGRSADALAILKRFGGYSMSDRTGTAHAPACSTTPKSISGSAQSTGTVQAKSEKLYVSKTPVQTGEVTVRKEVHTERKTIDVPVRREEVVIERRPGSGQPANQAMGGDQELRIPVTEEQVHVEKQPVVTEEVTVGKRQVKGTERVDETIRKEQVKVDTQGSARVRQDPNASR